MRMRLVLEVDARSLRAGYLRELADVARRYPGNDHLDLLISTSEGLQLLRLGWHIDSHHPGFHSDAREVAERNAL